MNDKNKCSMCGGSGLVPTFLGPSVCPSCGGKGKKKNK